MKDDGMIDEVVRGTFGTHETRLYHRSVAIEAIELIF